MYYQQDSVACNVAPQRQLSVAAQFIYIRSIYITMQRNSTFSATENETEGYK